MWHVIVIVNEYQPICFKKEKIKIKLTESRSCSSKELAVVGPKPCSFSNAASNASLLFPYSVLKEIGAWVASDTIPDGFCWRTRFFRASSADWPEVYTNTLLYKVNTQYLWQVDSRTKSTDKNAYVL